MKKTLFYFIVLVLLNSTFAEDLPDFKTLRQDEDWSFLRDKKDSLSFLDQLKFIPFGSNSYLSLGGELRERYEYYSNYLWGRPLNEPDGYFLHRVMVHSDFHFYPDLRAFIQLKSNTVSDKTLPPRLIDKDELDLHQAFLDVNLGGFTFRGGRQELVYGSSRLIAVRESPNVRQSFDALKLMYKNENLKLNFFFSRPVEIKEWSFDDKSDPERSFHGIYSTLNNSIDVYWLLLERKNAEFHSGTDHEIRHSVGARLFSRKSSSLDYDYEAVLQKGKFGDKKITAWTVATNTGVTWSETKYKPRIGLKADIASGDKDAGDNKLNSFNPLFPKGNYFNEASIIGPSNIIDLHPTVSIIPYEDISLTVDWDFLWRQTKEDGIYNIPLDPTVRPGTSGKKYIGSQLAFTPEWKISRHFNMTAQYMHFFSGDYLKSVTPGRDINFVTSMLTFKF